VYATFFGCHLAMVPIAQAVEKSLRLGVALPKPFPEQVAPWAFRSRFMGAQWEKACRVMWMTRVPCDCLAYILLRSLLDTNLPAP
jgi:hypothetical protein